MDDWKYVGVRQLGPPRDNNSFPMHVITVPHPNGEWAAIYCKTKEQAELIIQLRTDLRDAVEIFYNLSKKYFNPGNHRSVYGDIIKEFLERETIKALLGDKP